MVSFFYLKWLRIEYNGNNGLESEALERWMSGLSHTPGKRAWG